MINMVRRTDFSNEKSGFNLSTKIDVARDPWSAKCSGRITIRLFKRIVDRGQWIVESG